jgi:hypothetical protein
MALTLDGTNGIVSSGSITTQSATGVIFSDSSNLPAASSPFVLKNRIINGDMRIDQRNAGASVTITDTAALTYTIDRWAGYGSAASKFSIQQNAAAVTPPVGFNNYLGATSLSAYSVGASEVYKVTQVIEGYNVADLAWGTANAKTVTLSFWVRSSLTGTFGGALNNSAFNRNYPFTYTISVANTWEYKSITVAGDTSGTWLTTNGIGVQIVWSLGTGATYSGTAGAWAAGNIQSATGATSVVGTNGATFYITGVQLEIGSTATPFERIMHSQKIQLCQRYFYKTFSQSTAVANDTSYTGGIGVPGGIAFQTGAMRNFTIFPQPMRTTPTVTYYNTDITTPRTNNVWLVFFGGGTGWTTATATTSGEVSELYVEPNIDKSGSFTIGYSYLMSGFLTASAEL